MSEREQESPDAEANVPTTSQQADRFNHGSPGAGIWADTIMATNVVSGTQFIRQQVINVSDQNRRPPLLRPRRAENFANRVAEQAKLLAELKPGRIITICGPGGMGKTALVAEILWTLTPDDTPPSAFPDGIFFHSFYGQSEAAVALEQIARAFGEEPLPNPALAAQRALNGRHALLIFDGVEEANNLGRVLDICVDCAVLVTSQRREDAVELAYLLDLRELDIDDAVNVVQKWGEKRAADQEVIMQIYEIVGGLPLALRLVGRYLALHEAEAYEYLRWLQEAPFDALELNKSRRGSIRVLLERSIARLSLDAQEVLAIVGLLALAPFDRAIVEKALILSNRVTSQALDELVNYGLLVRLEKLYEVSHPLIHNYTNNVLLSMREPASKRTLTEQVVRALAELFPEVTYANWVTCKSLLPHVQACIVLIERYTLISAETARLLARAGSYLTESAQYTQADPILRFALSVSERAQNSDPSDTGIILTNLAQLSQLQGQYGQAESLYQRALIMGEQFFGPEHPNVAVALTNLAQLYRIQGRYTQAGPFLQRALAIVEITSESNHANMSATFGNLGQFYMEQGRYTEAESLLQRALSISEQVSGPDHPDTATALTGLALLYQAKGQYTQAETLLQHALTSYERIFGPDHPNTAVALTNLADIYQVKGQYAQAELLYQRALIICEQVFRQDHADTANILNHLGQLYQAKGQLEKAEPLYQRALIIYERTIGPDHPHTANVLTNMALLYQTHGQYAQAELFLKRTQVIYEQSFGPDHFETGATLHRLAQLYRRILGQHTKAEPFLQRAQVIYEQSFGPVHPEVGRVLHDLAQLYRAQGKNTQAELLLQRALTISEYVFGPDHPNTGAVCNELAVLYTARGNYTQAQALYQRAMAIVERVFGSDHPSTMTVSENYAELLQKMKSVQEGIEPGVRGDWNTASHLESSQGAPQNHVRNPLDSAAKKPSIILIAHNKARGKMAKRSQKKNRRKR